jgi:hypothetical protein
MCNFLASSIKLIGREIKEKELNLTLIWLRLENFMSQG